MAENARLHRDEQEGNSREYRRDLIIWLSLIPLVLLILTVCGQLALINPKIPAADTRSLLRADYQPWPFIVFRPVDPAILQEIQRDQGSGNNPAPPVATGAIWRINTPVKGETAHQPTPSRTPAGKPETLPLASPAVSKTVPFSITPASTRTLASTPTRTSTLQSVPSPTIAGSTFVAPSATPRPHNSKWTPTPTRTQPSTPTLPPVAWNTPTGTDPANPSPTVTDTPTLPAPINTPTPHLRVLPILEGKPVRNTDGSCTATWGYDNPNSYTVNIPVDATPGSPHNRFSPNPANRGQPGTFLPGRQRNVFTTTWGSGGEGNKITWILDGQNTTAEWCR